MALEIADAVIDPVISAVKDHIISVAKEEFKGVWYLRDDMDKTCNLVEAIQKWREDAEKKQLENKSVREWLSDFKNAVYDMEDLVCDFREMMVEAEDGSGVVARWMGQAKDGLFLLCGVPLSCLRDILPLPVTPRIEISHRLRTINKNLIEIEQRWAKLTSCAGESSGHSNSATTTVSSVAPQLWKYEERPMIGRHEMKAEIKEALLKHSRVRYSKLLVVGIVGAGGMGKTTLAHSIFSDEDVKEAYEVNKWQYVGDKFDIKKIMNDILERNNDQKLEDPTELHSAMREKFGEKSVLIVLDDAWSTNGEEWDLLQSSLSNEVKPHSLIVTARNKAVTRAICHESEYLERELVAMPDSECMEVFKRYAFMGKKDVEQRFEGLSKKVVERLKGIPLAARMMGGFLNKYFKNDDRSKWLSIVKSMELPDTEEGNVVDKITGLSYLHLTQPLRSCFAYCAIFRKGFRFEKENLVQMWIAQGYIHPHGEEMMENIGKDYFENLCQMSLLQHDYNDYYKMHDLIHDFAQKIFTEGCQVNASDTNHKLSEKLRHLSIEGGEFEPSLRKLRTLICGDVTFLNLEDVLANQFRYLRVWIINYYGIRELPDSIRHLQSLRYLDVSNTEIESLPEAVSDLINLQYLILPFECRVLHKGMSKLVNLRCLKSGAHSTQVRDIKGIGKLTSLQAYDIEFAVLNKSGWRISELKNLNHLHGTLTIRGLNHVKSEREAEQAYLKKKIYLEKLWLYWDEEASDRQVYDSESDGEVVEAETSSSSPSSSSSSQGDSSQVLEALSPPPFLECLYIDNKGGVPQQLPRWMDDDLLSTLVKLELHYCHNWVRLPKLGRWPSLKTLNIRGLKNVRKIGPEFYGGGYEIVNTSTKFFPGLETFKLVEMDSLEEWSINIEVQHLPTSSNKSFSVFPSLTYLRISGCPKLRTLSSVLPHLTALKYLNIEECKELTWLVEQNEGDPGLLILPSLNHLDISSCPKLRTLSSVLPHLTALKSMSIKNCDELTWLVEQKEGDPGLLILPSLNELIISSCPKLIGSSPLSMKADNNVHLGGLFSPPPSLKTLNMRCNSLQEGTQVSRWVMHHNLPSVRLVELTLTIDGYHQSTPPTSNDGVDCGYWEHLPTLGQLPSLINLTIQNIHNVSKIGPEFYEDSSNDERAADHNKANKTTQDAGEGSTSSSNNITSSSYFLRLKKFHIEGMKSLEEWMVPPLVIEEHVNNNTPNDDDHDEGLDIGGGGGCGGGHGPQHASTSSTLLISVFPSLTSLEIYGCPKLRTLSYVLPHLTALKDMKIKKCQELTSLVEQNEGDLGLLILPSLNSLSILHCPKLRSLSSVLPRLKALQYLSIWDCPELVWLVGGDGASEEDDDRYSLPPSLRLLDIRGCPLLEERWGEGGVDHPKIPPTTTWVHIGRWLMSDFRLPSLSHFSTDYTRPETTRVLKKTKAKRRRDL